MSGRRWIDGLVLASVWLVLRMLFFEGLWGYDDLVHLQYVLQPGVPENVFEARLPFNALLLASSYFFGAREFALALPGLLGSALFAAAAYIAGRRWIGNGLLAGLFAVCLPIDVLLSTVPMATVLANGFIAWGTVCLLDESRRDGIGSALLALGMACHLVFALYVLPLLLVVAVGRGAGWRRRTLVEFVRLFAWVSGLFLLGDLLMFTAVSGDPLLRLELLRTTHLADQVYIMPRTDADGSWSAAWLQWPLHHFLLSKHFWLLLSLPSALTVWNWRSRSRIERSLAALVLVGWAYLSYGSQHPFGYAPLDHQERYWLGLGLPATVLAAAVVARTHRLLQRTVLLVVLFLPLPLLPLASGSWGQNMEISRQFLAQVRNAPQSSFLTDGQTYEEIFLLSELQPPANLAVLADTGRPAWGAPSLRPLDELSSGDIFLLNPINAARSETGPVEAFARHRFELHQTTPAQPNTLAWLPIVGSRLPQRRPAVWSGVAKAVTDHEPGLVREGEGEIP